MPFRLDPVSFGDYTVVGQVDAGNAVGRLSTQVSVTPWGWLVAGLGVVSGLLVIGMLISRRRRRSEPETVVATMPAPPAPSAIDVALPFPPAEESEPAGAAVATRSPEPIEPVELPEPALVPAPSDPERVLVGATTATSEVVPVPVRAGRRDRPVPVLARPHRHQRPVRRDPFPGRFSAMRALHGVPWVATKSPFTLEGPVLAAPTTPDRAPADAGPAPTTEDRS